MSGLTLGHVLIGFGLLDAVTVPLLARSVRRANPGAPGAYVIIAAGLASAVALCLLGLYLPQAQIPVF